MANHYPDTVLALRSEIERAKVSLAAGKRVSEIANQFHREGLSALQIILVFREVTGASLADLKSLGQWWGLQGVTDESAFNARAAEVLSRCCIVMKHDDRIIIPARLRPWWRFWWRT